MDEMPLVVEDYLNYLETIKGTSSNTVKEYMLDLRTFFRFLKKRKRLVDRNSEFEDIDISDIEIDFIKNINIQDLHAYISYVDKYRNNGQAAKARKVASLKSFFNYLYNTIEVLDKDPSSSLEFPKKESRFPTYLSLEQAKKLLKTVLKNKNKEHRLRDYTIIVLFLNCGLRLSELASINVSSIKSDNTLTVIGKGNKERTIFLNDACVEAINAYLKVRPNDSKDPDALFISRNKNRFSNRGIQNMIDRSLEKAGLDTKIYSTHTLRHTAATLMYKYGKVDIRALQEILGHESVSTTQIYTHIDNERLRDAVDSNPLANLEINE